MGEVGEGDRFGLRRGRRLGKAVQGCLLVDKVEAANGRVSFGPERFLSEGPSDAQMAG